MTKPFAFTPYQLEDYARFALHPGGVLAHDTGIGKSLAEFVIPMLWCGYSFVNDGLRPDAPVLLVVPGDGHEQTADEGKKHFRARVTIIDSVAKFLRLSSPNPTSAARILPPGFYLTSYTQLTGNGVADFPDLATCLAAPLSDGRQQHPLCVTPEVIAEYFEGREQRWKNYYEMLHVCPTDSLAKLKSQWFKLRKQNTAECVRNLLDQAHETLRHAAASIDDLTDDQLDWLRQEVVRRQHKECSAGIGQSKSYPITGGALDGGHWTVKCCYDGSLADWSAESFACVSVDEGTKMKGEDTIIGLGVRQMNPRYRLVLTATPIKNRLPDAFSLVVWATHAGPEGNARFPYGDTPEDRTDFEKEFLQSETNISKQITNKRRCVKRVPMVTNIHRLWKLFAPAILRRRKKDCGVAIVAKHRHVVRCPLGKHQAEVYKFHLDAKYRDKNNLPAVGAKLQALRIVAANPASALLERPEGDDKTKGPVSSRYDYIPKLASVLSLLRDLLQQNEQAVVFSAFNDSLDVLAARLSEAGVRYVVCDGRMSPKHRGKAAKEFKAGKYQVMLAGVESMAELHSFAQCSHVLLMCYSWAYDKFEQAINRIHRMNSPKDVHVWSFLCDGSVDGRLEGNIHEKSDSSELVLDGQLLGEQCHEVNLWELLTDAQRSFSQNLQTIDEHELERTWPPLRQAIALAAARWRFNESMKLEVSSVKSDQLAALPLEIVHEPEFAEFPLWEQSR